MSNNLRTSLQHIILDFNLRMFIIVCLLPVGIGSTYFIQERRYQAEKKENLDLQAEISRIKSELQSVQYQIKSDNARIKEANQEVKNLNIQLEIARKTSQELKSKLASADETAKIMSDQITRQEIVVGKCMTNIEHVASRTKPLYQTLQKDLGSIKTFYHFIPAIDALSEFHGIWDSEVCQNSRKIFLNQVGE